jgi:hypothetical protein
LRGSCDFDAHHPGQRLFILLKLLEEEFAAARFASGDFRVAFTFVQGHIFPE